MIMPVDREEVEARWRSRGFSCGLWVDPPGQRWEGFVHPTDEVVLVIEGDVEFEFSGTIHRPGPGEELIIPAGTEHSARNVGSSEARWLYGYRRGGESR